MNRDATTDNNSSSDDEQPTRSTTDTYTFLETCVLDADQKTLEEHLESNLVRQSDLDRCLVRGLHVVQREEKELSHVAYALTILLHFGAKWNRNTLLDEQKTPYHIICESPGDHHELLDMLIKSCQQRMIDAEDSRMFSALVYAVNNANINCLKCLIANGADVIGKPMWRKHNYGYLWSWIARLGNVELLKCLFNRGIDKDCTDQVGLSVLWWVVVSGNIEAVRYLLDMGVAIFNYAPTVHETQCEGCKKDKLVIECKVDRHLFEEDGSTVAVDFFKEDQDPCMGVISDNNLDIVKLLDERGSQSCKSFTALRHAVIWGSVDVARYLLNNYAYPLNIEYIIKNADESRGPYTLLTEPRRVFTAKITELLLDHGAYPDKPMCSATSRNAIMTAICHENVETIVQYIRSGVNINCKSSHGSDLKVLPFEASVLHGCQSIVKMLLVSGCSCGVFSLDKNHKFKDDIEPEVEKLMKEWKVQENNVTPLKQRCRSVILNHLSPRADVKIGKLPLPGIMIKFLSIPELDAILDL